MVLFLSILPFLFWQGVYEGYKVLAFWIMSFILFLVIIFKKREELSNSINKLDIFYWLWIVVLTVSSIFGIHPIDSLIGGSYRHQGVIFFIALWVWGKSISMFTKKQKKYLKKGLIAALLIESAIILFQVVSGKGIYFGRPMGTFGEPNAVGGFLALSPFFTTNPFLLLLIFASILLTQSRTAIIALFVSLLGIFKFKGIKKQFVFVGLLIVVTTSVFLLWQKRKLPESIYGFEDRSVYAAMALKSIWQKPILGHGAESGEKVFGQMFLDKEIILGNFMVDRSHNLFLDVAMWSGILGLIPFLIYVFGNMYMIYQKRQMSKLFPILGFLTFSFFQPLGVVHWILFFLMLNW